MLHHIQLHFGFSASIWVSENAAKVFGSACTQYYYPNVVTTTSYKIAVTQLFLYFHRIKKETNGSTPNPPFTLLRYRKAQHPLLKVTESSTNPPLFQS